LVIAAPQSGAAILSTAKAGRRGTSKYFFMFTSKNKAVSESLELAPCFD
jgi:hypothetical protein